MHAIASRPGLRSIGLCPLGLLGLLSLAALVANLAGCSSENDDARPEIQTEFRTAVPPAAPPAPVPAPGGSGGDPGGDAEREIREADLLHLEGSILFALSRWRGLFAIDLADAEGLAIVARLPLSGQPDEMIVREERAVVVCTGIPSEPASDEDCIAASASRILVLDLSDPRDPKPTAALDVEGVITDTRLVGDIFYVVSVLDTWCPAPGGGEYRRSVFVTSFDLTPGHEVAEVDRRLFDASGWEVHAHVTSSAAYLAMGSWDAEAREPVTCFRYVDISDPGGMIRLGAEFSSPGWVEARWQMSEFAGVFRVILRDGIDFGTPSLDTFEVRSPSKIVPLAHVPVALPRPESLTAARFDGDRAYLVTYERVDPLFVFDLSDPAHPVQAGELEMSGWLDHIVPRGDRLVALGHDDASGSLELAVSLIDVADPFAPSLVDRVAFGAGWIGEDPDDLDKVFRILDEIGLVLVPFVGWIEGDDGIWRPEGRVQLIDLDLAGDRLEGRGVFAQTSTPRRAVPFEGHVLTVSDSEVSRVDIADRDHPEQVGHVVLARNVQRLVFAAGTAVVLALDSAATDAWLVLFPEDDPDALSPLSELPLDLGRSSRIFADGSRVYVIGDRPSDPWGVIRVQTADLADPLHPRACGFVDVPGFLAGCGYSWGWAYPWTAGEFFANPCRGSGCSRGVAQVGGSTLVLSRLDDGGSRDLVALDLSDPEAPQICATLPLPEAHDVTCPIAVGTDVFVSYRLGDPDPGGDPPQPTASYFLRRIDLRDPSAPVASEPIALPGRLLRMGGDRRHALTLDFAWGESEATSSLCSVEVRGGIANLLDRMEIGVGFDYEADFEEDRMALLTMRATPDNAYSRWLTMVDSRTRRSLRYVGEMDCTSPWRRLLDVVDGKLFLLEYPGLAVYDVRGWGDPVVLERRLRYTYEAVPHDGHTHLLCGWYGVLTLE